MIFSCKPRRHFCMVLAASLIFLAFLFPLFSSCKRQGAPKASANAEATATSATTAASATEQDSGVRILATFFPLYVMLLNITEGSGAQLSLLAPANTGCLHDYQLTTRDMQSIEKCDILVANGAGMEDFLEKALELKKDSTIVASQGYSLIQGNAHVWVSPSGAAWQVRRITDGLKALDSRNAHVYEKNAAAYIEKLRLLSEEMHSRLSGLQGRSAITFHEAFPYFANEFGFETLAVVEREPGTEPSARELADVIALIKNAQAQADLVHPDQTQSDQTQSDQAQGGKNAAPPMLFAEPQYSSSAAKIIAAETGLTVKELDPAVTAPQNASDGELKDSYLAVMRKNLLVLESSL